MGATNRLRRGGRLADGVAVAVNVSPAQFKEQTLVLAVVGALGASGLAARRLAIEITEAVLIACCRRPSGGP
jgi:predicted signal transduction protein with EAL and GGDEF domain